MNWGLLLRKIPLVISGTMAIIDKIKGASGAEKKNAVMESIPQSLTLIELGLQKKIFDDHHVREALSAYIDGEAAMMKLRDHLQQMIIRASGE